MIFFFVFEMGSLVCGLANSSSMLIGGRAIAGLGASGLMNGGMTIIAGAVPLEKRPCEIPGSSELCSCCRIAVLICSCSIYRAPPWNRSDGCHKRTTDRWCPDPIRYLAVV
jgi:hypothetical protein